MHVVADGSDAEEVEVGVGSTTIGPQSSPRGHGDASLGGREPSGIAPCGIELTVHGFGVSKAQSGGAMGVVRASERLCISLSRRRYIIVRLEMRLTSSSQCSQKKTGE